MSELIRLLELAGMKAPTIVSASTEKDGGINRTTADRIIDPKGFFAKNKRAIKEDDWERRNAHETSVENAESFVLDHFDPEEFIASEEFQDITHDGLHREEVLGALSGFLRGFINNYYMSGGDSHEADTGGLARSVYHDVTDALRTHGLEVI
jgi:hypothetical protein